MPAARALRSKGIKRRLQQFKVESKSEYPSTEGSAHKDYLANTIPGAQLVIRLNVSH
jgi:hypothetical protein